MHTLNQSALKFQNSGGAAHFAATATGLGLSDSAVINFKHKNVRAVSSSESSRNKAFSKIKSRIEKNLMKMELKHHNEKEIEGKVPMNMRAYFAGKAEFKEFFAQFNQANLSFMEVAEVVNCYRCELGQILEQVRSQFGTLFESVLGLVYR